MVEGLCCGLRCANEPVCDVEAEVGEFDGNLWGRLTPRILVLCVQRRQIVSGRHQIRETDSPPSVGETTGENNTVLSRKLMVVINIWPMVCCSLSSPLSLPFPSSSLLSDLLIDELTTMGLADLAATSFVGAVSHTRPCELHYTSCMAHYGIDGH